MENKIRVITVEFNAWEYSGCDYLWAGIVTNLGSRIEDYFGTWTVRLCRVLLKRADDNSSRAVRSLALRCCFMRCKLWMLLLCLLSLLAVSATVITVLGMEYANSELDRVKKMRFVVAVTSFTATLTTLLAGKFCPRRVPFLTCDVFITSITTL